MDSNSSDGLKRLIALTATCLVVLPSTIGLYLAIHAKWDWVGVFWGTCGLLSAAVIIATCILFGKRFLAQTGLIKEKRKLLAEIESKDRLLKEKDALLKEWEEKSEYLCDFCHKLAKGDHQMNAGDFDAAIKEYEDAVNENAMNENIPANFRGPQRLALLTFITEKRGEFTNPVDLFARLAMKNFTQFAAQRALSYLNGVPGGYRGLHNISQLIYTLKITGNPHLFSLLTDSKTETRDIAKVMNLHMDLRKTFAGLKDHYMELLERYFDLLLNPAETERILKSQMDSLKPLERELRETCEGCPFNLYCLYTFSDVILHTFSLSKKEAENNTMADEVREIIAQFAPALHDIFRKYRIPHRDGNLRGWPSVVRSGITDFEGRETRKNEPDPYVTAFVLRFMSANSGLGLGLLGEGEIKSALQYIQSRQEIREKASATIIAGPEEGEKDDGCQSEFDEPVVTLRTCGAWRTRYWGFACWSALLAIEMAEQLLLLFEDKPALGESYKPMIQAVVRFTNENLGSRIGTHREATPYIVDYAAHSDYYRKYKYSDIAATAAAIRFLLLQPEVNLEYIMESVEWLAKQQNPKSGAWPVVSSHTLSTHRKSVGYEMSGEQRNESLFNSVSVLETFLSWVGYVKEHYVNEIARHQG